MKKILFLTHYFPPEVNAPANRTFEHCKVWAENKDVEITVITNFPNHPDGKIFKGYENKLFHKEKISGINVIRLWTFITPNEGFALRTLNFIIYMIMSVLYVVLSGLKFDIVIATSPQFFCGAAGKYISILKRKPFILEIRDLWPESIIAVGALKNKMIIKILEGMEISLYQKAKKIICVTQSFKEIIAKKGIPAEKIDVKYNGVSPELFSNGSQINDTSLREFLHDGFRVGYIGTIGMAHSISTLVSAAEKLKDSNVKFCIVGSGAERPKIEKLIESKNLDNVRLFPLQPKNDIPSIISKLDLFCVHLKNDDLFKTVIPSKIFEGMIMKKPILLGVNGETRRIIEESGAGIYFEPENVDDLVSKIQNYLCNNSQIEIHGENGYKCVTQKFDRKVIAEEYLKLILSASL